MCTCLCFAAAELCRVVEERVHLHFILLHTNLPASKIVEYPEWLVPANRYLFDPVHQYFTAK